MRSTRNAEYTLLATWMASLLAAICVVPTNWVPVPSLVAGVVFVTVVVYRWFRWRGATGFMLSAVAMLITTSGSLVANELGHTTVAAAIDLFGSFAILSATVTILNLDLRAATRAVATIFPGAALLVWCTGISAGIANGHNLVNAAFNGVYTTMSFTAFALAVLTVWQRREIGLILFVAMLGSLFVGDTMYLVEFAGRAHFSDRVGYTPYVIAYGFASSLFLPTTARHIVPSVRRRNDPWPTRGIVLGAVLAVCFLAITINPTHFALDTTVRSLLGCMAAAMTAARLTSMARAERNETRQFAEEASVDAVTGLPTRAAALNEWRRAAALSPGQPLSAIVVVASGLDDIDLHVGPEVRDGIVDVLANRVSALLPEACIGVQADGKIFALAYGDGFAAGQMALRLQSPASMPVTLTAGTFTPNVSIGYAAGDNANAFDSTLRLAMRAAHHAVNIGGNCVASADALGETIRGSSIETVDRARTAVDTSDCTATTRTLLCANTGTLVGIRTNVTWGSGRVPMSAAQIEHLISDPDRRLSTFADMLAASLDAGINACGTDGDWKMFVEATPAQMVHPGAVAVVEEACKRNRFNPSRLTVLLREQALTVQNESLAVAIETLNSLGVEIGVSHFGDGHLGLSRMRGFPITWIELSDSVACRIHTPSNRRFVTAVAAAGSHLGWQVMATCADSTPAGFAHLNDANVTVAQVPTSSTIGGA